MQQTWSHAQADETSRLAWDRETDERIADLNRCYDAEHGAPAPRHFTHRYLPMGEAYPVLFQPFDGAVILRGGQDWWGPFHCCGVYLANGAEQAQRAMIERDHLEALRRNDWLERARVRFELTDAGRAALAGRTAIGQVA